MFRLILVSLLLNVVASQKKSHLLDTIYEDVLNNQNTVESLKCSGLEGSSGSCLACYTCDDDAIVKHTARNTKIHTLKLVDTNCTKTEVCCVTDNNLIARSLGSCGSSNPNGFPRRRRPSLRSVLEGEFPWRAWLYRASNPNNPLCAANYVFLPKAVPALLATATCVRGVKASELVARFSKRRPTTYKINDVIVHVNYSGPAENDIALLPLQSSPDAPARAVCLPQASAQHGTACLTVSDTETYINTVIPLQKMCKPSRADGSVLCSVGVKDEYHPQAGAGLFCLEEQVTPATYTLYGISLDINNDTLSYHTSVAHYANWVKEIAKNLPGVDTSDSSVRNKNGAVNFPKD